MLLLGQMYLLACWYLAMLLQGVSLSIVNLFQTHLFQYCSFYFINILPHLTLFGTSLNSGTGGISFVFLFVSFLIHLVAISLSGTLNYPRYPSTSMQKTSYHTNMECTFVIMPGLITSLLLKWYILMYALWYFRQLCTKLSNLIVSSLELECSVTYTLTLVFYSNIVSCV